MLQACRGAGPGGPGGPVAPAAPAAAIMAAMTVAATRQRFLQFVLERQHQQFIGHQPANDILQQFLQSLQNSLSSSSSTSYSATGSSSTAGTRQFVVLGAADQLPDLICRRPPDLKLTHTPGTHDLSRSGKIIATGGRDR